MSGQGEALGLGSQLAGLGLEPMRPRARSEAAIGQGQVLEPGGEGSCRGVSRVCKFCRKAINYNRSGTWLT
jgi:hypothetical protein